MRGNLTRRGRRSWRLKFDAGRDQTGKRITKYVTLSGTRTQAQAEAARIIASTTTGTYVDPSTETVAGFVERWLRDWANANVSNKTFTRYDQLLRKHVCVRVGSLPIQKLSAAHLQTIYAEMAQEGLAERTRLHVHRVISRMLGHAAQWGIVVRNVATLVDAPRVKQHEIEVLTSAEVQTVLERLRGLPLYIIASVLLATGLRRGELLAVRWQDVDLGRATLRVERALEETKRGGLLVKEPKTKRSKRTIALPPSTVILMREHRRAQQEQRLVLGLGRIPDATPVFSDWDGSLRRPHWLTQAWRKAMKAAGLKVSLHSLRHTHASTLITQGVDIIAVSRRLGHATPVLTLTTYGHLLKPDDRAAEIMEAVLGKKD